MGVSRTLMASPPFLRLRTSMLILRPLFPIPAILLRRALTTITHRTRPVGFSPSIFPIIFARDSTHSSEFHETLIVLHKCCQFVLNCKANMCKFDRSSRSNTMDCKDWSQAPCISSLTIIWHTILRTIFSSSWNISIRRAKLTVSYSSLNANKYMRRASTWILCCTFSQTLTGTPAPGKRSHTLSPLKAQHISSKNPDIIPFAAATTCSWGFSGGPWRLGAHETRVISERP